MSPSGSVQEAVNGLLQQGSEDFNVVTVENGSVWIIAVAGLVIAILVAAGLAGAILYWRYRYR